MTPSQHRILVRRAQQSFWVLLPVALLCSAIVLLALPLHAQETPSLTPSQIAIAAQRGDQESRQLLLRSDGPISALDFFSQDLTNAAGTGVLPARAIDVVLPLTGSLSSPMTMDLLVDLAGVPPGAYSGDALLTYGGANQWLNLRVSVKDPPWLALLVLLVGVALGAGLNYYRQSVAPRDTKLVEINDLLREVDSDQELHTTGRGAPFRKRIELYVADAGSSVRGGAWDDAQQHLDRARHVLEVWRRERDGWRKVLERQETLRKDLTSGTRTREDSSPYLVDLRLALDEVVEQAVDEALLPAQEGAQPVSLVTRLDERLKRIYELSLIYANESGELAQSRRQLKGVTSDQAQAALAQIDLLESELRQVRPWSDANAMALLSDLHVRIKRSALEVASVLQGPGSESEGKPVPAATPASGESTPRAPSWPALEFIATPSQIQAARGRKRTFQIASFVVAVALLAGAGFQELYLTSATFGSNPWADYFGLLAWGFGAEATRAAITDLVRNWDVPLLGGGAARSSAG